jgi:hypothetical protein
MLTAPEYHGLAEECFRLATRIQPHAVKQAYIDLGKLWLETASRLEKGLCETLVELELEY